MINTEPLEEIIARIKNLSEDERVELFDMIVDKWCISCGSVYPCQCDNDE